MSEFTNDGKDDGLTAPAFPQTLRQLTGTSEANVAGSTTPGAEPVPGLPALGRQVTSPQDLHDEDMDEGKVGGGQGSGDAAAGGGASSPFTFRIGGAAEFGGKNKTNQDDYFTWEDPDNEGTMVILVLDGHGRELGELASGVAKDSIFASLCHAEGMKRVAANPQETITECFAIAHSAIRDSFVKHYEAAGMETVCEKEGYVTKRRPHMLSWTCAHGGTTASIIVILNGRRMIIGNVGDSTAMLCGAGDIRSKCSSSTYPIENDLEASGADTAAKESFTTLSAEHSPESESEFRRMRTSKPCPKRGNQSEMVFVYDSPSMSKLQCPEVFALEAADKVRVTGRGQYYKNVRCEWASLVTTPSHARFQDALAFTRSLGDLHMQVYGVSHVPDVVEFDLTECIDEAAGRDSTCLVVCSDGIWDNWTYGDVAKYVLDDSRVPKETTSMDAQPMASTIGAKLQRCADDAETYKAVDELMNRNMECAEQNFGSHADNMTAVVCYIKAKA